ncbi:MAG: O-antigen polymerase [Bacteroidales bacterium]|nr:O-antigen polymerase [Bacteroidales bacterium]
MALFVLLNFLLTTLYLRIVMKDKLSFWMFFLYAVLWYVSLFVSTFDPFSLYHVSSYIYILLIVHIWAFIIGASFIKIPRTPTPKFLFNVDAFFSSKPIMAVMLVSIIFCWYLFFHQRFLLATAMINTGNIKVDILNLLFDGSRLQYYFYTFVCSPLEYIAMALFSYMILYKRNLKHILITLALIVPMLFIGGGRNAMKTILYFLAIVYLSQSLFLRNETNIKPIKISLKTVLYFAILLAAVLLGISYMTFLGGGFGSDFDLKTIKEVTNEVNMQLVTYSIGGFRALEYSINHANIFYGDSWSLGRATFAGLDYDLELVLHALGFDYRSINYDTVSVLQNTSISVGSDIPWNYAYTSLYFYIHDFGILGVFFIPLVLGFMVRLFVKKLSCQCFTIPMLCLVSVCFLYMHHSPFSLELTKPIAYVFIVVMLLWNRSVKWGAHNRILHHSI